MKAPLPEVRKTAPEPDGKQPFPGLNIVFGVAVFLNVFSMTLICFFPASDAQSSILATQLTCGVSTLISFFIDFYLWRGFNVARWITIVSGVFALVFFFSPAGYQSTLPQIERVYNMFSYAWWFGVALWLLLPGVARHFKTPSGNTSSEINAG